MNEKVSKMPFGVAQSIFLRATLYRIPPSTQGLTGEIVNGLELLENCFPHDEPPPWEDEIDLTKLYEFRYLGYETDRHSHTVRAPMPHTMKRVERAEVFLDRETDRLWQVRDPTSPPVDLRQRIL